MTRMVLFPTDFSPLSEAALAEATRFAEHRGATLLIAHVIPHPASRGVTTRDEVAALDRSAITARLESTQPTDPGVPCEHRLLEGDPAEQLVRLAENEQVELIVLATHGDTVLRRHGVRSVTELVVRAAPCSVVTFKPTLLATVEAAGANVAQPLGV